MVVVNELAALFCGAAEAVEVESFVSGEAGGATPLPVNPAEVNALLTGGVFHGCSLCL